MSAKYTLGYAWFWIWLLCMIYEWPLHVSVDAYEDWEFIKVFHGGFDIFWFPTKIGLLFWKLGFRLWKCQWKLGFGFGDANKNWTLILKMPMKIGFMALKMPMKIGLWKWNARRVLDLKDRLPDGNWCFLLLDGNWISDNLLDRNWWKIFS